MGLLDKFKKSKNTKYVDLIGPKGVVIRSCKVMGNMAPARNASLKVTAVYRSRPVTNVTCQTVRSTRTFELQFSQWADKPGPVIGNIYRVFDVRNFV